MDVPNLFLIRARQQLHILGFWFPPQKYTIAYCFMRLLSFFLIYSLITCLIVHVVNVWGDLDEVSETIYLLFIQSSVGFKMTMFYIKMKNMKELFEFMEINIFKAKTKKHEEILKFQAKRIKRVCVFFLCLVCSTCTLWALKPALDDSDGNVLPFKIWLPFRTDSSPIYEFACIYLNAAMFISGLLFNGIDNVPLSMIMFACAQLQIIKDKVLNWPVPETYSALYVWIYYVRFIRRVEQVYNMNIFYQVCGSVGIICMIGLRISIVDRHSVQFFSMVSFLQAMLLQLFSYCWCGHKLTTTGEDLRESLYMCPWYTQNKSFNKSLWTIMERMKLPIVFRTGGYIGLSFTTFVAILRSSYSYFAVLKQVRDK